MIHFLAQSEIFAIAVTCVVYYLAQKLFHSTKFILLNPVLISIVVIIAILKLTDITYEEYDKGGRFIGFLLKPAIVSLGVPLYLQLEEITKQKTAIILSQLAGCIAGIVSVVFFAWLFGASRTIILSLAAKSVTTPIAMEVTKAIGGVPAITAGVVIAVGIFGAIFGIQLLKLLKIKNEAATGLSMGAAAHGIGTARVADLSPVLGAYSSLGMILNGIFTAVLMPFIIPVLEKWMGF